MGVAVKGVLVSMVTGGTVKVEGLSSMTGEFWEHFNKSRRRGVSVFPSRPMSAASLSRP